MAGHDSPNGSSSSDGRVTNRTALRHRIGRIGPLVTSVLPLVGMDAVLINVAVALAYLTRFGVSFPPDQTRVYNHAGVPFTVLTLVGYALAGLYRPMWRYASVDEILLLVRASLIPVAAEGILRVAYGPSPISRIVVVLVPFYCFVLIAALRVTQRVIESPPRPTDSHAPRVLIIGAGAAGALVAKELRRIGQNVVGFVDDDPRKRGQRLMGLRVVGPSDELAPAVQLLRANQVLIAMPSAKPERIESIVAAARELGLDVRIFPGFNGMLRGAGDLPVRPPALEDLLPRPVRTSDTYPAYLRGACVLVTGAGGSIGAEICRQVAACEPAHLHVVGHGENSIFQLLQQLRGCGVPLTAHIASVQDAPRMRQVFQSATPNVVFHAAAHKHVSLMEADVEEAILNNVGGTRNVLSLSAEFRVGRFVLISTDKAVNPTSVMGATKRVCELLVFAAAQCGSNTEAMAVRFGNVLGSRGSVVPIFQRQIAAGGPVTVTHPDVKRYFMVIPEAVHLVLQAGALGGAGDVFVLDMGTSVPIVDLARKLMLLSGRTVPIVFTGLHPGEKLDEELYAAGEDVEDTAHPYILRIRGCKARASDVGAAVDDLLQVARAGDRAACLRALMDLVPEFAAGYEQSRHQAAPSLDRSLWHLSSGRSPER